MKIALITDAWSPQVNGVVRTLEQLCKELKERGHQVRVFHPGLFKTLPCPSYPEIRLALLSFGALSKNLESYQPDCIHIATEGPLGYSAYRFCQKNGFPYTTAFHTQFPEYIYQRIKLPTSITYAVLKKFHNRGAGMLVTTPSVREKLENRGFTTIKPWTRGIDTNAFYPHPHATLNLKSPIQLYVGRVAVEKNLEAFLELQNEGTKVVVGEGPALAQLKAKYPDVVFLGKKTGEDLCKVYSAADVFVFPSKTDTFGLVMLEALACGTPVAAYPVQGPVDVITNPKAGALNSDLNLAIQMALKLNSSDCTNHAKSFSWKNCTDQFIANLAMIKGQVQASPLTTYHLGEA